MHINNNIIGYARVSTNEQDVQLQLDALEKAGCSKENIFIDHVSGARSNRPGLEKCLSTVRSGDTSLVETLRKKGVGFRSICDGSIDTTTASGELIFNIFSSLAQFERKLIQERTRAGLIAARARGRTGGRKKIGINDPRVLTAKRMHKNHGMSINEICKILKISRPSFYRYLALPDA
jgi:DNA invertase Pin-like site-specific DNA recombinase